MVQLSVQLTTKVSAFCPWRQHLSKLEGNLMIMLAYKFSTGTSLAICHDDPKDEECLQPLCIFEEHPWNYIQVVRLQYILYRSAKKNTLKISLILILSSSLGQASAGVDLQEVKHQELNPVATSWRNTARKGTSARRLSLHVTGGIHRCRSQNGNQFQGNVLLEKMSILGIRPPQSDGTVRTG